MATVSAVSKAQVAGLTSAFESLKGMADTLTREAEEVRGRAARGGSLFASPDEVSALHVRSALLRAARELAKSAVDVGKQADALSRGPCPGCGRTQPKHCSGCGACPGMMVIPGRPGHLSEECPVLMEKMARV